MDTVTTQPPTRPAIGTVDYYADLIRRHAKAADETRAVTVGIIEVIAEADHKAPSVRVDHIRNVLAAAKLIRDEMQADR